MRIIALIYAASFAANAVAADWNFQVDQPTAWYDPQASHHRLHLAGGAAFGAVAFTAVRLATDDERACYGVALVGGAALATGYELWHGRDGASYVDPVDVAWTVVGAGLGAIAADVIGEAITVSARRDGGSVAVAFRF